MKELIKITENNGGRAVSAKDLHQLLNCPEQFSKWIERFLSYGYVQGVDYEQTALLHSKPNGGYRKVKDYALTLDTAKEIAMLQRSEKGRQIRLYFIEVEKLARQNMIAVPQPKEYNGIRCIHYTSWLLQHGYSLMSSRVGARIRKYPDQFRKGKDGWYMSEAIANYFLAYRNLQAPQLESVHPNQLKLFV